MNASFDDDAFGAPDYDSDGEPDLRQADEGEIQSIAAISAPLNGCAMEDGRTLHLVLPSFNVARNAAGVDDLTLNYLDQIAGDDRLPSDQATEILLYCRSGSMSAIAARGLNDAGYTNIVDLDGGMVAWEAAGLPILQRPSD